LETATIARKPEIDMKRREVITLLGGSAAWPLVAHAQPRRSAKIGILNLAPTPAEEGLKRGLRELGHVEGRTVSYEARYADGRQERLDALAAELLALRPNVIASSTTEAILAIRRVNKTVPIVMTATSDPIGSDLIASLSRPGGFTTGVTLLSSDVAGKRLELLKEIAPNISRVAVLAYKNHPPTAPMYKETQAAARALKVETMLLEVETAGIEGAFESIRNARMQAVIVQHTVAFVPHVPQIAALTIKYRLPAIHEIRAFADAGGLMSYGANIEAAGRRAAAYVDKILKGVKPGDLPVEQPTRFELIVNLKAARTLGLTVAALLLASADETID
jgi:putative ABC transport system substrate-binding protein